MCRPVLAPLAPPLMEHQGLMSANLGCQVIAAAATSSTATDSPRSLQHLRPASLPTIIEDAPWCSFEEPNSCSSASSIAGSDCGSATSSQLDLQLLGAESALLDCLLNGADDDELLLAAVEARLQQLLALKQRRQLNAKLAAALTAASASAPASFSPAPMMAAAFGGSAPADLLSCSPLMAGPATPGRSWLPVAAAAPSLAAYRCLQPAPAGCWAMQSGLHPASQPQQQQCCWGPCSPHTPSAALMQMQQQCWQPLAY